MWSFIRHVHEWGGKVRNTDKVIKSARRHHFVNAMVALDSPVPQIKNALKIMTKIKGLGISFGSKHLRMLRPDICPILDKRVREKFNYQEDLTGYKLLYIDVSHAAQALQMAKIYNPMKRSEGRWYAGDVDMAIFAFIKKDSW